MSSTSLVTPSELRELSYRDQMAFALFCVNQIKDKWRKHKECIEAIELIEKLSLENNTINIPSIKPHLGNKLRDLIHYVRLNRSEYGYYEEYVVRAVACTYYSTYINGREEYIAAVADFVTMLNNNLATPVRNYYKELRYIDDIFEKLVLKVE